MCRQRIEKLFLAGTYRLIFRLLFQTSENRIKSDAGGDGDQNKQIQTESYLLPGPLLRLAPTHPVRRPILNLRNEEI